MVTVIYNVKIIMHLVKLHKQIEMLINRMVIDISDHNRFVVIER
jgi:hypothetical protein